MADIQTTSVENAESSERKVFQKEEESFSKVKFYKISECSIAPERHTDGAAGYDLRSIENATINPSETVIVKTGLFIDLPKHIFGMILSRSGLSVKFGLEVKNSYVTDREEICVTLHNNTMQPFHVEKGMRIAQLVFMEKNEKKFEYTYKNE